MTTLGDPLSVRAASVAALASAPGVTLRAAAAVASFYRSAGLAEEEREVDLQLAWLGASGVSVLHLWHPAYPPRLAAVYDAPPVLFVRGDATVLVRPCIAVVGTRRPTPYGLAVAGQFARDLAEAGAVVVSGLARGIDTKAHRAALEAGGNTVAVTGTGPDRCYPPENRSLESAIAAAGAVVSEHPPGTGPEPGNFPRRNRIISGLTAGTLIVESDTDGGAMITAYLALDQDREVFAVPGNIHSRGSRGCHALIQEGKAKLAAGVDDVLSELGSEFVPRPGRRAPRGSQGVALTERERTVAAMIGGEPIHLDDLAGRSELPVPDLLVALLSLEMADVVRQLPGKYFIRRF